jgi:acyl CoA:acetate/3-ketoacid CoA transferase alpha subunit
MTPDWSRAAFRWAAGSLRSPRLLPLRFLKAWLSSGDKKSAPPRSPKETRVIKGKNYVLEYPIYGDVALIKAEAGDRWGNLTYRKAARNFGPIMAVAARFTVATVHSVVELGELDPESVVTPGIHVSKIVKVEHVATQAGGFKTSH